MDNKNRNIVLIIVSLAALVILVLCYFLFFATNNNESDDYPRVEIYKYEIASNDFKYYLEKLDATKIALKDTIKYRCNKKDCEVAKSLFVNGNIDKDNALIKDEYLLIYDYKKNEKITIEDITDFDYVNFINDGKYILISKDNYLKAYNINERSLSSSFKSNTIVTKDNKIFTILDKYIVTLENGKYGIVNLDTGNNIYDNEYDYIDCLNNYCIFTNSTSSTVYDISKDDDNVLIQSARSILYNDDKYIIYKDSSNVLLLNISTSDIQKVSIGNDITVTSFDGKNIDYKENNKCYSINTVNNSKIIVECSDNYFNTDIFVSTESKMSFMVKSNEDNKDVYDLKTNNTKLYSNSGEYYDYISIDGKDDNSFNSSIYVNVKEDDSYAFLDNISNSLQLNSFERMVFLNKWLPVLERNNNSYVELLFLDNYDRLPGVNIITNSDQYKGLILLIHKGTKGNAKTIEEINIDPIERKGLSVVSISGISY